MLLPDLPADILITLFCLCDLYDLLRIEQTCRRLRDLASTHQVWLTHLRQLDQAHAFNLPYHIDLYSLKSDELRTMVIRAAQAHDNVRNGVFGKNAQNRDIYLDLIDPPSVNLLPTGRKACIDSYDYAPKVTLFPGGEYLLVQWTHGFVQLIDTDARKAIWTYPDPPSAQTELWYSNHLCYDVDFRGEGYANVALFYCNTNRTDKFEEGLKELMIEVFRISLKDKKVNRLYSRKEKTYYPGRSSITMEGDFLSLQCNGSKYVQQLSLLIIVNFVRDQIVFAKVPYASINLLPYFGGTKIIREHLFLSWRTFSSSITPFLRVLEVRNLLNVAGTVGRVSSTAIAPINFDELEYTDIFFELPDGYGPCGSVELPSLCSFHWKEERERYDQLTVAIETTKQQFTCRGWFINRYVFTSRKSSSEPPTLSLISSSKVFPYPNPSYAEQWLVRLITCSLSGFSIMLHEAFGERHRSKPMLTRFVMTTIDESSTDSDADFSKGQQSSSLWAVPKWLSLTVPHRCKLDHLSGAIIYTSEDQRWIKIAYPA